MFKLSAPLNEPTDQNSWRKGLPQWILVLLAITLGLYSHLVIGRKVETEIAVLEGMEVLKDVRFFQWLAFATYNLVLLVYYHQLVIKYIKSGCSFFRSVLFLWCRTSDNDLETTFKIDVEVLKSYDQ